MYTITKRNGSVAEFDVNKIKNAITKAFEACRQEYHPDGIDFLVLKVMSDFEKKVKDGKITVEEIQDSVESVLGKAGYDEVAKAYILYRRQHEKLRDAAASVIDYKKVMDGYLKVNDWRVKENSTVTYSVGGLILSNSGAMTANYWLSEVYDDEIGNAHRNADIHLHDLSMLTGYCFTGDTRVKTLDGKNPTFKELVDRGVNELWVYAYDRDRKEVVPAKAIAPRVTRMTQEMIRLSLCTGVQIECTPDHLFMMRDGSFRPAKELHPNDSVMPLYISEQGKICTVEKVHYAEPIPVYDLTVPGYENFAIEGNVFVHNCAGWSLKQLIQEGLGGVEGKITSAPAQHLSTLCNQMVNFLGIMQNEWAGAQAFSSFDTYLAPFAKKDCLTYKEVKQCIQSFIYGVNTPSRWGCCPITTKVATPNGFKSVDELKVGDVIYTWLNGTLHEAPLEHIIRRKNDYNVLHRYKGVNYVQTVTPEHRCLVEMGSKRGKYGIRQSMDIFGKRGDLRMPMCIKDVDVAYSDDYSDDEIMLAAMMYTDGGKDMNDIRITKSVIRDTGLIRAVLERLGLTYTVYERKESTNDHMIRTYRISDQHREYIQTLIGDKYAINDDFCHLGREQSELFIRTWAAFDGNVSGRIACQYDNENIRNSLELIMLRAGYVSHVWSRKKPADKNATNYLYAENRMSAVISEQEEIPYDGEVWCPNTKDGTAIYKDENGNIFISGNCQAPFTNITLDWTVPADLAELNCIVGGKEVDFKYKDCQKEMDMVNKAFIEIMIEGDANGRGFQWNIAA